MIVYKNYQFSDKFHFFTFVLGKSVEKHGEEYKPTLVHITNIAKLANNLYSQIEAKIDADYEKKMDEAMTEMFQSQHEHGTHD